MGSLDRLRSESSKWGEADLLLRESLECEGKTPAGGFDTDTAVHEQAVRGVLHLHKLITWIGRKATKPRQNVSTARDGYGSGIRALWVRAFWLRVTEAFVETGR